MLPESINALMLLVVDVLNRLGRKISERQWRDILGVLKLQAGQLEKDYLSQWASALSIADLLGKALKEAA